MTFTIKLYEALKSLGSTRTQYDFSVNWLGRSKSYMSAIKARGRDASPDALATAYVRLDALIRHLECAKDQRGQGTLDDPLEEAKILRARLWEALAATWAQRVFESRQPTGP